MFFDAQDSIAELILFEAASTALSTGSPEKVFNGRIIIKNNANNLKIQRLIKIPPQIPCLI
jgi:hypothetical protein